MSVLRSAVLALALRAQGRADGADAAMAARDMDQDDVDFYTEDLGPDDDDD